MYNNIINNTWKNSKYIKSNSWKLEKWNLELVEDDHESYLGSCDFIEHKITIYSCNNRDNNELMVTLAHEVAHAIYGKMGHTNEWLNLFQKIALDFGVSKLNLLKWTLIYKGRYNLF